MQDFFNAVRKASSSRSWSRGIELARDDAVDGLEHDEDSVTVRVKQPGRTVAPVVTLFLEDDEWVCSCDSKEAVCSHAAAATIAVRKARQSGRALPQSAKAGARIGYRLGTDQNRLTVARVLVSPGGGTERNLRQSLGTLAGQGGMAVEPSEVDLSIDRLLQLKRLRIWPSEALPPLFALLSDAEDVRYGEDAVRVRREKVGPRVRILARGRNFIVRFDKPAGWVRPVAQGVGLFKKKGKLEVGLLDMIEVTGTTLDALPAEVPYPPDRVAELITAVVPDLKKRASDVTIDTDRLPDKVGKLEPMVTIEVEQKGGALSVLPVLVYGDPPCARIDGDRLVHLGGPLPKRNLRAEQRVLDEVRETFDLIPGHRVERTGKAAVAFAEKLRSFPGPVFGDAHIQRYPDSLPPSVSVEETRFSIHFGDEDHEADADVVISAWRRGDSVVPLLRGGWAPLPRAWLAEHGGRVADLLAARQPDGALPLHAEPVLAELCAALDQPPPPRFQRLRPLVDQFEAIPETELPADLAADLRDYQRQGVDWLCFLRDAELGAILADDMGLGKTIQAMCALRGRALVVCPRSVVHNWKAELTRFRPQLAHAVYHGTHRRLDEKADVTLTTYALLRNDIERLRAVEWDVVILDESQAIKNPDSQVARAAYQLQAKFRLTLSGTPVENRLEELWSQVHFTNPGLLGARDEFRERYERPVAEGLLGAAKHLRQRIRPFVLRRTKDEVLTELPPRTDSVMHCELDEKERAVYDAVRAATLEDVVQRLQGGGDVLGALEALLRLRQAACDGFLVPGQGHLEKDGDGPRASSKVRTLLRAVEEIAEEGRKALVFSQWTSLLDRVQPHLDARGIDFERLDGKTTDREGVVSRFQGENGPPVMLLSLKAGGTGLNLTAADHVFLLDPWWNPAAEDQAADRAHRIGQDRPVNVYRMVAKDTVEERILVLQEQKRAIAEAALGEADRAAGLTRDDLMMLLE